MQVPMSAVSQAVEALIRSGSRRAVKYLDPKTVVSVCRRSKYSTRDFRSDFVLKIGRPNYLERKFIKLCKAAGESFPVRKVQLQPWPVRRTNVL